MSRELLKLVIAECSDEGSRSNITTALYCEIAEYLEMPEPGPVASINGWYGGYPTVCSINGAVLPVGMALYPHAPARLPLQPPHTTQIDQSARIAELDMNVLDKNAALLHLTTELHNTRQQLAALRGRTMKLYNVPRNSYIQIQDLTLLFSHLDGMYSVCFTIEGDRMHLSAFADVEIIPKPKNWKCDTRSLYMPTHKEVSNDDHIPKQHAVNS